LVEKRIADTVSYIQQALVGLVSDLDRADESSDGQNGSIEETLLRYFATHRRNEKQSDEIDRAAAKFVRQLHSTMEQLQGSMLGGEVSILSPSSQSDDGFTLIEAPKMESTVQSERGEDEASASAGAADGFGAFDALSSPTQTAAKQPEQEQEEEASASAGAADGFGAFDALASPTDDQPEGERKQGREQARKEAEEQAKKEAEEQARKEAEEQARKEAEEQAKKEVEEQARKEAEEQARKEAEEQARKEAEEQARKEAEEQARKEAEEQARKEAEEQARKEAEEQAALAQSTDVADTHGDVPTSFDNAMQPKVNLWLNKATVLEKALLFEDHLLKVGLQQQYKGSTGRVAVFFFNISTGDTITDLEVCVILFV
jgi:hypothetical protein